MLKDAVREIVEITVDSFCGDGLKEARRLEPFRELISIRCDERKLRHIARLRVGVCEMKQGFSFNGFLNNLERIADHCFNVAVAMIEMKL